MWFVFGLVTLLGSIVLVHRHRREDRWVGTAYGRIHVEERRNPKTGTVLQLWSRIDADPALDFELKLESWLDRLAKFLRLSNEAQVGRPPFDRLCYVVSDDPAIRARLRADPALTERLRDLVEIRGDYHFHRLVCRNGRLRVDFKPARKDPQLSGMLPRLQTHLQGLAELAPSSPSRHRARDPYLGRSLFLLALSGGLAVSGFVQAVRVALFNLPFCVDVAPLWAYALPVAAVLVLALLVAALLLLAGTSRAHLVMLELLLVGGFGAIAVAWTEVRDFNIEADRTVATELLTTVQAKHERRGRRGRHSYHLVVTDWNGGRRTQDLRVSARLYARVRPGQSLAVLQHPGALGARWVERLRPLD